MANFSDNETPSGAINGSNTNFTWANAPSPPASLRMYKNGDLQVQGSDYTQSGVTSAFVTAPSVGDTLVGFYRF